MSVMTETLAPNLYRIEVPLFDNPLRSVNCYVIRAGDAALVIDTGWNRADALKALTDGLAEISVNPETADYFVTHRHPDHFGLVTTVAGAGSKVYMGAPDIEHIRKFRTIPPAMLALAERHGFPVEKLQSATNRPVASPPSERLVPDFHAVGEGDSITIGDYAFTCIETPGHSPGHICLYDTGSRIIVSGDHVLGNVTPNISSLHQDGNPLREYRASLAKVMHYDVALALPGHRSPIRDFRGRIKELVAHLEARSLDVRQILNGGALSAYEVAGLMRWDLSHATWADFPLMQQWFATGETLSHLKYLAGEGLATADESAAIIRYRMA